MKRTYSVSGDFILAPGGVSPNKNVSGLIKAFRALKKSGLSYRLLLTGNGEETSRVKIRNEIRQLQLEQDVILTGHVPRTEMPTLYNASSLVVYPTLYEGFGLPALEAMACGAPLITSNNSSLPEVVNGAALLVDPRKPDVLAEAISYMLREHNMREAFVQKGLHRAQQFSWRAAAESTVAAYMTVISRLFD